MMMKKLTLFILIFGLLTSVVWLIFSVQKRSEDLADAEIRAESIPAISLSSISGERHTLSRLSSGGITVLIYFNSTCEICQMELTSISDRISEFKDIRLLLVSSQEKAEVAEFYKSHPLKSSPQVYWLIDEEMEVAAHYDVSSVPAIYCYDALGKLQGKFQGPAKVDFILGRLGISNASKL